MKKLNLKTFQIAKLVGNSMNKIQGGTSGEDGGETIVKSPPRCVNGSRDYVFD